MDVLREVTDERTWQDAKWGRQNHEPAIWLMILGEEVGEATKAALEAWVAVDRITAWSTLNYWQHEYRRELIQVAAVAVAMVESLDRNELALATEEGRAE